MKWFVIRHPRNKHTDLPFLFLCKRKMLYYVNRNFVNTCTVIVTLNIPTWLYLQYKQQMYIARYDCNPINYMVTVGLHTFRNNSFKQNIMKQENKYISWSVCWFIMPIVLPHCVLIGYIFYMRVECDTIVCFRCRCYIFHVTAKPSQIFKQVLFTNVFSVCY